MYIIIQIVRKVTRIVPGGPPEENARRTPPGCCTTVNSAVALVTDHVSFNFHAAVDMSRRYTSKRSQKCLKISKLCNLVTIIIWNHH